MSNVLVVYYSRSGNTRAAAERLAHALDAELEEITEARSRRGVLGYLRSGFEAFFHREPNIRPSGHDASKYDVVVVATPIWNASLSSPVRSYLAANRRGIRQLGALVTCGGMGMQRVLRQIEDVYGRSPCARAVITDEDRKHGTDAGKIDRFANALLAIVPAVAVAEEVHA